MSTDGTKFLTDLDGIFRFKEMSEDLKNIFHNEFKNRPPTNTETFEPNPPVPMDLDKEIDSRGKPFKARDELRMIDRANGIFNRFGV